MITMLSVLLLVYRFNLNTNDNDVICVIVSVYNILFNIYQKYILNKYQNYKYDIKYI
jgi:hypothetical protein